MPWSTELPFPEHGTSFKDPDVRLVAIDYPVKLPTGVQHCVDLLAGPTKAVIRASMLHRQGVFA